MAGRSLGERFENADLLVRLHDTTTGLAIGVGLLKGPGASSGADPEIVRIRTALEDSLANLRGLTASLADRRTRTARPTGLRDSLTREARRLGLTLDLKLTGDDGWLPPRQSALLELSGREAMRNVRRHAGTRACRITLDVASCPFEMRVRDWGSGLGSGVEAGHGLALLRELAAESGCTMYVSSQPGLGTEVVLTGPACPRNSECGRLNAATDLGPSSEDGEKTAEDAEQAAPSGQSSMSVSRLGRQMKARARTSKEAS